MNFLLPVQNELSTLLPKEMTYYLAKDFKLADFAEKSDHVEFRGDIFQHPSRCWNWVMTGNLRFSPAFVLERNGDLS